MSEFWSGHLEADEKLLWEGRPEQRRKLAFHSLALRASVGVILVLVASNIFFYDDWLPGHGERFRDILLYWVCWASLPALLLGVVSPRLYRFVFFLRNKRYALTNKRAVISNAKGKILLYWVFERQHLPWKEPDAVIFGRRKWRIKRPHHTGFSGKKFSDLSGFEMIPDADHVYRLAMKAIEKLTP